MVLDLTPTSRILLDGLAITADDLQNRVPDGLAAVATFQGRTGAILTLEAFSDGKNLPAASLTLSPSQAVYQTGQSLTVELSPPEARRLGKGPWQLRVPGTGAARQGQWSDFPSTSQGGLKATVQLDASTDLVQVPVLLKLGNKVLKGGRISVAAGPPRISGYGPKAASSQLASIPGWVDLSTHPSLINLQSARLTASRGLRVVSFQPRVDRCVFELQADGPGEYWLEFRVADRSGRVAKERWPLRVLP